MHELIRSVSKGKQFSLEGEVYLELFDRYVGFVVEDTATVEYIVRCAEYFNSMADSLIDSLCEAFIHYCNGFLEEVGEGPRTFKSPRTILNSVSPIVLIVPNLEDLDEPVIHMEEHEDVQQAEKKKLWWKPWG